jgi:hypothetical protein
MASHSNGLQTSTFHQTASDQIPLCTDLFMHYLCMSGAVGMSVEPLRRYAAWGLTCVCVCMCVCVDHCEEEEYHQSDPPG